MTDKTPKAEKADKPKKPRRQGHVAAKGTRKLHTAARMPGTNLTPQQEAYCRARAMGMAAAEALAVIGSPVVLHTAREWERTNTAVRERIEKLTAMATQSAILKTGLDREWVISRLMGVVERCMTAEPVRGKDGEPTGQFRFDANGANQALKMLGDTLGLFKPAEKKPEDDYAHLSDDDIARIAAQLAAETGLLEAGAGAQAAPGPQQVIEVQALPAPG